MNYTKTLSERDIELLKLGLCKGVYVPQWQPVEKIKTQFYTNSEAAIQIGRHSYLKAQDLSHISFFEKIRAWLSSGVSHLDQYSNVYPTSGSSEGFRYVIQHFGNNCRDLISKGSGMCLMKGEYEGYYHYAADAKIPVTAFDRNHFEEDLKDVMEKQLVIISEPSAIDGNYWKDLEVFLNFADEKKLQVWLDFAYHGTTYKVQQVNLNHTSVKGIFFSFSKSFGGCFYDRIGGILSKMELPGLIGNLMWFKNAPSFQLANLLLDAFPESEKRLVYQEAQEQSLALLNKEINAEANHKVVPSDVFLLGYRKHIDSEFNDLERAGVNRFVMSPQIDKIVNNKSDADLFSHYENLMERWSN